jgi:hypothetical protein
LPPGFGRVGARLRWRLRARWQTKGEQHDDSAGSPAAQTETAVRSLHGPICKSNIQSQDCPGGARAALIAAKR